MIRLLVRKGCAKERRSMISDRIRVCVVMRGVIHMHSAIQEYTRTD